jgi:hypothetical protein
MQTLSADVDHHARRGVQPCAASSTNELVHDTCSEAYHQHASNRDDDHRRLAYARLPRLRPGGAPELSAPKKNLSDYFERWRNQ